MFSKSWRSVAFAAARHLASPRLNLSISAPHIPVMVPEILQNLNPKPGQVFLDMTFGAGGHTRALFESCSNLTVYGLDQDPIALQYANDLAELLPGKFFSLCGKFSEVGERLLESACSVNFFDGVIMDLGASSMQLDSSERGFGFSTDSFLDMRMAGNARSDNPTAADVLSTLSASELSHIFKTYGEERFARRIANAIVDHRNSVGPIRSTGQLADLICSIVAPSRNSIHNSLTHPDDDVDDTSKHHTKSSSSIHVATRVFQALRIFVNNELNELCCGLEAALLFLKPGGRAAVISFHSLEDRIVKWAFSDPEDEISGLAKRLELTSLKGNAPMRHRDLMFQLSHPVVLPQEELNTGSKCWVQVGDVICPSDDEVLKNRRSRSAKLRVVEKI